MTTYDYEVAPLCPACDTYLPEGQGDLCPRCQEEMDALDAGRTLILSINWERVIHGVGSTSLAAALLGLLMVDKLDWRGFLWLAGCAALGVVGAVLMDWSDK